MALRVPAIEAEVRSRLLGFLAQATGARVSIGHVGGSLLFGVRAHDVRLAFPAGARMAAAELAGSYTLPALLGSRIEIGTLRLRGVRVRLVPTAPAWGFDDLVENEAQAASTLPTLRAGRILIEDGRVVVPPWRVALADVSLDAGFSMDPETIRVSIHSLSGIPRGVALSPLTARGDVGVAADGTRLALDAVDLSTRRTQVAVDARVAFERSVRLRLAAASVSPRELRALVPGVRLRTDVAGTLDVRGPWRRLAVRTALRTPASGAVRLFATLDAGASDLPYRARARLRQIDLAAVDRTLPASDLTGRLLARGALRTLDVPPLAFRLDLSPSKIASTELSGARVAGHLMS